MLKYISLVSCLLAGAVLAQSHPFEELRGLQRFDKSSSLPTSTNTQQNLDIKGVKIGDNVLQQSINLADQGGEIGRIRGGTRSDKVKFDFSQPYQDTTVNQVIELYFDKGKGFINKVTSTYRLDNAYVSIEPLRKQSLQAAIDKYGSPLTLQQAQEVSGQPLQNSEIKLASFIRGLQQNGVLNALNQSFWQQLNISRSAKWVADKNGLALLNTGFDRCYFWPKKEFNQLLSFCFFDKSGGNAASRGIELSLMDFTVSQQIADFNSSANDTDITL